MAMRKTKTIVGTSYNRETGTYRPTEFVVERRHDKDEDVFIITDKVRKWTVLISDIESLFWG